VYYYYGVLEYTVERQNVEGLDGKDQECVVVYGLNFERGEYGLGSERVVWKVVGYRCLQGSSSRCTYVE
jgi:hypothetical protein